MGRHEGFPIKFHMQSEPKNVVLILKHAYFTVKFEDKSKHTVRGRMLGTKIDF